MNNSAQVVGHCKAVAYNYRITRFSTTRQPASWI